MVTTGNAGDGTRNQGNGGNRRGEVHGRYTRFSDQQVEIFEKVYGECQNPTRLQRLQMLHEYPVLRDVNIEQIKVWFQNRRCREKQRRENIELQAENQRLIATNKILTEENDLLQKKVASGSTELNFESVANSPQLSSSSDDHDDNDNDMGLILLAEETLEEFLLKAIGAAMEWTPIPGIKPGYNSNGIVYVSHNCAGVAARACAIIPLGPVKIMEILKERASWSGDCRNIEVFAKFPARNGGNIELIYMQFYASTTRASARDFWTLRYTSALEDGSLVVCEKSLSGSSVPINAPAPLEFIRAKMLASGYLIRPCESGGSTIHIVDHLDLEASSVPYVLQPFYESPELLAQKITVAAIGHLELIAKEMSGKLLHGYGKEPASLRSFSQRINRSFNDAINSFTEDGWLSTDYDVPEDLVISTKLTRNLRSSSNYDGILCVKASMLLQSVSPVALVRLLRDHRSDWADIPSHLSDSGVLLGHTLNENEILEIFRVDHQDFFWKDYFKGSLYLLQICNGMEDNGIGACSELIFAPMDGSFSDDAMLLSSGFRILSLGSKTCNRMTSWSKKLGTYMNERATPSHPNADSALLNNSFSVLITAFQFPFEKNRQEEVAMIGLQYMHRAISFVLKLARSATPSGTKPEREINIVPDSNEPIHLAYVICQSYRSYLGRELLRCNTLSTDSLLEQLWHHEDAILCWSFQGILQSFCLFANRAGLEMLETTLADLPDITIDEIIDDSGKAVLSPVIPRVMQQGCALLSAGICLSKMARYVWYQQAVAWNVPKEDGSTPCIAFAFSNWSFI